MESYPFTEVSQQVSGIYYVCNLLHFKVLDLTVVWCVVPGQDIVHDDASGYNFSPGLVVSLQKEAPVLAEDDVKCRFEPHVVVFEQLWRSEGPEEQIKRERCVSWLSALTSRHHISKAY